MEAELEDRKIPVSIARFRVLSTLGSGSMGVVYAAWDPQLDRRVALKLVRLRAATDRRQGAQGRLLREAQALARVADPNVVSVFDVGEHDGAVWIAMEFVEGQTLADWLAQEHPWRAQVEMFIAAGRGLAAAHDAGLIHRDFKPENVLVGGDGRPRVADFGLVAAQGSGDEDRIAEDTTKPELDPDLGSSFEPGLESSGMGETRPDPDRSGSESWDLQSRLTRAGALLGTPRYMSPEQFAHQPVDPRCDQFSFCVALYEALYGCLPFAGERLIALADAVLHDEPRALPRETPVPDALGRALMRGLARKPDERHADMRALLAALEAGLVPRRRTWAWAVMVSGAVVLAALGVRASMIERADPCAVVEAKADVVWGGARRRALRSYFEDSGLAYASSSLRQVEANVDGWTENWVALGTEVCKVGAEQSPALHDLRVACLEDRLGQLDETLMLLGEAGPELIRDAPRITADLGSIEACVDAESLRQVVPPSEAKRDRVGELREQLQGLKARRIAAQYEGLEDRLNALREAAAEVDYLPLSLEVELTFAELLADMGELDRAAEVLRPCYRAAVGGRLDRLALETAMLLVRLDLGGLPVHLQYQVRARWNDVVDGLSARLGRPAEVEIERRKMRGRLLLDTYDFEAAKVEIEAAIELAETTYGPEDFRVAEVERVLVVALGDHGYLLDAIPLAERVVAQFEAHLGPDHPLLISVLTSSLYIHKTTGHLDQALTIAERLLVLSLAGYGESSDQTLEVRMELAVVYDLRGEHRRAAEQFELILNQIGENEQISTTLGASTGNSLCFSLYEVGELDRAEVECRRMLEQTPEVLGVQHPGNAIVRNNLALIARAHGNPEAGLVFDREALDIVSVIAGAHPYVAYSLVGIGEGLLDLDRPGEAADYLERALAIREPLGDNLELGEAQCLLARALDGDDAGVAARARALALSGSAHLSAGGTAGEGKARACQRWLFEFDGGAP